MRDGFCALFNAGKAEELVALLKKIGVPQKKWPTIVGNSFCALIKADKGGKLVELLEKIGAPQEKLHTIVGDSLCALIRAGTEAHALDYLEKRGKAWMCCFADQCFWASFRRDPIHSREMYNRQQVDASGKRSTPENWSDEQLHQFKEHSNETASQFVQKFPNLFQLVLRRDIQAQLVKQKSAQKRRREHGRTNTERAMTVAVSTAAAIDSSSSSSSFSSSSSSRGQQRGGGRAGGTKTKASQARRGDAKRAKKAVAGKGAN